jgi:putative lipoprotein
MKSLFFTTVVGGVLLLQGCAQNETPKAPAKITKPVTIDQPEIMPQTFMLHGEMVLGHETRSLAPCGGKQQYWLDMPVDTFLSRPYRLLSITATRRVCGRLHRSFCGNWC